MHVLLAGHIPAACVGVKTKAQGVGQRGEREARAALALHSVDAPGLSGAPAYRACPHQARGNEWSGGTLCTDIASRAGGQARIERAEKSMAAL